MVTVEEGKRGMLSSILQMRKLRYREVQQLGKDLLTESLPKVL